MSATFDHAPVIGAMPPALAAERLRAIGEGELADELERASEGPQAFGLEVWPFEKNRAWQHTAHTFGYIAPADPGEEPLPIRFAGTIPGDPALRGARVKVTLDRLRVADYPGGGVHQVLFEFAAKHQGEMQAEPVRFALTTRVKEGATGAVVGWPIFVGLGVADEGLAFECRTVNVLNEGDEAVLNVLGSDLFKQGLALATTAQPAIAPFVGLVTGAVKLIAGRNRNVAVQEFRVGLDFSRNATGARLAEGSYVAAQIPEAEEGTWDWDAWVFNRRNGQIVGRADATAVFPYNYVTFGVSRC